YNLAREHKAVIKAVIQTHPHADFVSGHLQIHKETGATIYNSEKLGADYEHQSFDDGDTIKIGEVSLSAINTPGHSPDSITIIAKKDKKTAMFTGDTLFIGDVGRPDLRENVGNMKAKRQDLAEAMYNTIQTKFNNLPDSTIVYPAHGAGSLCGKNLSSDSSSTLGNERMGNWAFKKQTREEFVNTLLDSQPFIPSYFGYDVDTNKRGAENLRKSISDIPLKLNADLPPSEALIVDIRDEADFKKGHFTGSINLMAISETSKFETWLGAIIKPEEQYYLVLNSPEEVDYILNRVAKIGYEKNLKGLLTLPYNTGESTDILDINKFKEHPENYTIVDIRNPSETSEGKIFESAISKPLNELRETSDSISKEKPIVVHCAGGYRSAAGSSILARRFKNVKVYDLSEAVKDFQ
ncbi:MAG: rhodanese-like domain-containing protein, partial [Gillisia sp.]